MQRLTIDTDVDMSEAMSKRQLQVAIGTMAGPYEVTIKPINPKRSNPQNRFFWRVVCQSLAEWFTQQGQPMCKDQAKVMLCEEFLGVPYSDPQTGEFIKMLPGKTSDLSVPEFGEFLENCIAWMSDHGIELPPPPVMEEQKERRPATHRQPVPDLN